jgi:hypothetical protein
VTCFENNAKLWVGDTVESIVVKKQDSHKEEDVLKDDTDGTLFCFFCFRIIL